MANYYEFSEKLLCSGAFGIEETLYTRDIQQRKFYYSSDIEPELTEDIVRHILQINKEDKDIPVDEREHIKLYLCSNGGDVDAGFQLIDAITESVTPVDVINTGWCYSMAFFIFISASNRYATKNAKFLLHDGSMLTYNSTGKVKDLMEFNKETEERIRKLVLNKTSISEHEYDGKQRDEWYMYADEAKKLGIVDHIVGEDVSIYEVV